MDKVTQLITKADIFYHYFRSDANAEARRLYQEAINLNPSLSQPYADLAYAQLTAWLYNWDSEMENLDQALFNAKEAVEKGDSEYYNHWVLADVRLYRKEFDLANEAYQVTLEFAKDQAVAEEERAVHVDWADMLLLTGNPKKAIELVTTAIQARPVSERWFYWVLGWAYYVDKQYDKSLEALYNIGNPRDAIRKNVIANLVALDRLEEANAHAKMFLREEEAQGITFNKPGGPVWPVMEKIEDRVPFQDDKQLAIWKGHLETVFVHHVAP
jgi:adenylate cyclase